jgi:hypothetical protein
MEKMHYSTEKLRIQQFLDKRPKCKIIAKSLATVQRKEKPRNEADCVTTTELL